MLFTVSFDDKATSAVADTFKTMAALISADTLGHRCRLRKLQVGPADDAPADLIVDLQIRRIEDLSAGGAGTKGSNPTPLKVDPASLATVITAGVAYSAEPTVYGEPLWEIGLYRKIGIIQEWEPEDAFVIIPDQVLGLLAAPRTAALARLSGSVMFEQF